MKNAKDTAALWLQISAFTGLVLSLAVFFVYAFGIFDSEPYPGPSKESGVSPAQEPSLESSTYTSGSRNVSPVESAGAWHITSAKYKDFFGISADSGWMFRKPFSGYKAATAALAILASAAFPMILALAVLWFLKKNYIYAIMSIGITGVLIAAILS